MADPSPVTVRAGPGPLRDNRDTDVRLVRPIRTETELNGRRNNGSRPAAGRHSPCFVWACGMTFFALTAVGGTGCILPNDEFEATVCPNLAPQISAPRPTVAVSPVDVDRCEPFLIQAEVLDPDSRTFRTRWVVKDEDDTRWLSPFDVEYDRDPNTAEPAFARVFVGSDFSDQVAEVDNPAGNHTAVVVLYVTDAPRWFNEDPDIPGQGQQTAPGANPIKDYPPDWNLAALPPAEETGGILFSVTSFSWAFEFSRKGQCPDERPLSNEPVP